MNHASITSTVGQPRKRWTDITTTSTLQPLPCTSVALSHAHIDPSVNPIASSTWRRPTAGLTFDQRTTARTKISSRISIWLTSPLACQCYLPPCLPVSSNYHYKTTLLKPLRVIACTELSDDKGSEPPVEDEDENGNDVSDNKLVFRHSVSMI